MSGLIEKVTNAMAGTTISDDSPAAPAAETPSTQPEHKPINASTNEAVLASAAEGRRLYIGNLAYATTEAELKEFFKGYLV
jgi:RNA recognition motif-containing protein